MPVLSSSIWMAIVSATLVATQQTTDFAKRLDASELHSRMNVVTDLEQAAAADPSVLADPHLQKAILTLLESENARVVANLVSLQATGRNQLDEAYAEYYSQVLLLANRVRTDNRLSDSALDSRLRRALVFGVYNPDSEFVADLAREGDAIVPFVLELSSVSDGPSRSNANALIGELVAGQKLAHKRLPYPCHRSLPYGRRHGPRSEIPLPT